MNSAVTGVIARPVWGYYTQDAAGPIPFDPPFGFRDAARGAVQGSISLAGEPQGAGDRQRRLHARSTPRQRKE